MSGQANESPSAPLIGAGGRRIVQAPMAGGPSTIALAAAVSGAGGLGFLAAGYLTADLLAEQIAATQELTTEPFGVNIFAPVHTPAPRAVVAAYAERIAPRAEAAGVELGTPRFDDDQFDDKLIVVTRAKPAVVSFAFGCPDPGTIAELRARGIEVWITVTSADEAQVAVLGGADAIVVQGAEAGGHRGSFADTDDTPLGLSAMLEAVRVRLTELPVRSLRCAIVAAGGLHTGAQIAEVIAAGADAAQLGTAFMLTPEAATTPAHRIALAASRPTTLTRAFSGRLARGIANAWSEEIGVDAPSAYPEIHHLTSPLRAHGRAVGDPDLFNLWAGVGHEQARALPAAELVAALTAELDAALPSPAVRPDL
ncbi:MAG: 2-nitropropane dioxygenase [Ilumatobacteraceae bacterium]|nr:2-nitropropane dioxygenase [Ilumatobacteraceae bacterium]